MAQPKAKPKPTPERDNLARLLALFQLAMGNQARPQGSVPIQRIAGDPSAMGPDAGDLYDFNYSNGDPGITGLFGSTVPPQDFLAQYLRRRG